MSRWAPFPEVTHRVTHEGIAAYAEISGDSNPLHVDPEYAKSTRFGSVIAHGPIGLQAVFDATLRWLGTESLPPGVGVDAAYRAPLRPGDDVVCRAVDVRDGAGAVVVDVSCATADGTVAIQAAISVPRHLAPRGTG